MLKLVIIIFVFVLTSCTTKSSLYFEISTENFKDRTLQKCLLSGYADKSLIKKINNIDRSIYNPEANAFYDEEIEIYLKSKLYKFKLDSINSFGKISEGKAGIIVFDNCLQIYKSKELTQFSKKYIRTLKKKKNLVEIFNEKNPAF